MLNQQTTDQLRALKLTGMLEAWEQQREQPQTHDLSFDERLALLVEREVLCRENRRLARLLAAKLQCLCRGHRLPPSPGTGEGPHGGSGQWRLDPPGTQPVITGPTGCGKTWLACALGNQACTRGCRCAIACPPCSSICASPTAFGSWPRLMDRLLKMDLLQTGASRITAAQRQDLMEVIEDRHGRRSTLIASQLPTEHWHDYIGEDPGRCHSRSATPRCTASSCVASRCASSPSS